MRSSINGRRIQGDLEATVRRVLREELLLCSSSNPDELVDTEVAAVLVGVTAAALRRAHERGQFPVTPVRVGEHRELKADLKTRRGVSRQSEGLTTGGSSPIRKPFGRRRRRGEPVSRTRSHLGLHYAA